MTEQAKITTILYKGIGKSGLDDENQVIDRALSKASEEKPDVTIGIKMFKGKVVGYPIYHCSECGKKLAMTHYFCSSCGQCICWDDV